MSSTHYREKACVGPNNTLLLRERHVSIKPPFFEKGILEIGKLNIGLIVLIIVISIVLISQDETSTPFNQQAVRVQSVKTPEIAALNRQDEQAAVAEEHTEAPKAEQKTPVKIHKKHAATKSVAEHAQQPTELVDASPSANAESVPEHHSRQENDHPEQKEPSRSILVFNIWSVSELRLRSTFTTLINDGSAPAAIIETRKKEYLNFVNKRTRKCGELHNKFASNINTVEKLILKDKDVDILECHTSENITELNRLNE